MSLTDTEIENTSSAAADDADDPHSGENKAEETSGRPPGVSRRVSLSLRTILVTVVMGLLAGAVGVLGWLYWGAHEKLDAQARDAGNSQHAEEIAANYAVEAAGMDYQDLNGWKAKLVKGTSPDLTDKLTEAADSMEQVLAPLQWKSTAKPLATKVRSNVGGIYTVDSFVSVLTETVQAPEGLQSTATYSVTIDSNNGWQITDVGGIDSVLGG